jgi:probable FeS assembly SUF system protein SufT
MHGEPLVLKREVESILIPAGDKYVLPAGSIVVVTQSLGGTFTVQTELGMLARIQGKDHDALGLEKPADLTSATAGAALDQASTEKAVWEQLRTCFDPEIPVNIVELGLVYHNIVTTLPEGGMGDVLKAEAAEKIKSLAGIKSCVVEVVLEPVWNPSLMTEAARLQLGFL